MRETINLVVSGSKSILDSDLDVFMSCIFGLAL